MSAQPSLFDAPPQADSRWPEGFAYRPDFISPAEEADLARWLATLPFEAFQFRGFQGRRRVVSFGWRYDFNRTQLEKADDMPPELAPLQARAAALAGRAPPELAQ